MAELALYNYFRSSTSYRVRIALHLKKLEFEYRPVHLLKSEQQSAEFRRLNPLGEVPALIHGSHCIAQSLAILEYLDEVFPSHPIYPKNAADRAWVRQFCENINSYLHPLGNLKVTQYLEQKHGYDQAAKEGWISHWAHPGFSALEKMLESRAGSRCLGDEITAADLCLIPAVFSAKRFKVDLSAYAIVGRIDEELKEHPAFLRAHPLRQIDTPDELKAK